MTAPQRLSLAVCAALALACGPSSPRVEMPGPAPTHASYGTFQASYVAVSHGSVHQEPPGGQPGTSNFEQRYYLSVEIAPGASGMVAELIVDSVPVVRGSDLGPLAAEARAAAGARFVSPIAASGELTAFEGGDPENPLLRQIAPRLKEFFLRLPPGGAAPGMTWSDTSSMETVSSGIALTVESVHRHSAIGWEATRGTPALRVRTETRYTVSGQGTQSGQVISIAGTGRGHTDRFLDPTGRYLSVTASDTTELTASVPSAGLTIPIRQTRHDTLRILPW